MRRVPRASVNKSGLGPERVETTKGVGDENEDYEVPVLFDESLSFWNATSHSIPKRQRLRYTHFRPGSKMEEEKVIIASSMKGGGQPWDLFPLILTFVTGTVSG